MGPPGYQATERRRDGEASHPTGPLRLVLLSPTGAASHALPTTGRVTLGRGPEADVILEDPELARLHVALVLGPTLAVEDLGSSHGTRVDGRLLRSGEVALLAVGSALELGGTLGVVQPAAPSRALEGIAEAVREPAPTVARRRSRVVVTAPAMTALHRVLERVCALDLNVLLQGEAGVGKGVLAACLHQRSPRVAGPFLRLDCPALPGPLFARALHGLGGGDPAVQGAAPPGTPLAAHRGTLFLDGVGELPAHAQDTLMQALDARDAPLLPKGLRVVSSTHRDLEAECAAGRFRRDLWERLRGVALVVPPLRARGAEVEALASWFLWESCFRSRRRRVPGLSSEVLAALRAWPWPGNLRELRSVIEHAALRCAGDAVALEHLPDALRAPPPEFSAPSTIL